MADRPTSAAARGPGFAIAACALATGLVATPGARAAERHPILHLGATTTVENSGLLGYLLPRFTAKTGVRVRAIIRGTGEVLRVARAGDVDVFIAHDPAAERAFLKAHHGTARREIMHNHFIIVGPKSDPARIAGLASAVAAFRKIAEGKHRFISRGDDSGTHRTERRIWQRVGINPLKPPQRWYMESGAGMGATLNVAAGRGAYTLTDQGTWLAFQNKAALAPLMISDKSLINRYGVTLVAAARIGPERAKAARLFFDWISGPAGQQAIGTYRIGKYLPFMPAVPPTPPKPPKP